MNKNKMIKILMYTLKNINNELAKDLLNKKDNMEDKDFINFLIDEIYKLRKGTSVYSSKQSITTRGKEYGIGFDIVLGGFSSADEIKHILNNYKFPMNKILLGWYDEKEIKYKSLKNIIEEVVIDGLIRGKGIWDTVKNLENRCSLSEEDCYSIVHTETMCYYAVKRLDDLKRLGIKKYSILGVLDKKSCDSCGDLDLRIFDTDKAIIGVNFPPFHIGCRCTTLAHFENSEPTERRARNKEGRSILVRGDMTYNEWKKIYL